jgi:hypothetical protein
MTEPPRLETCDLVAFPNRVEYGIGLVTGFQGPAKLIVELPFDRTRKFDLRRAGVVKIGHVATRADWLEIPQRCAACRSEGAVPSKHRCRGAKGARADEERAANDAMRSGRVKWWSYHQPRRRG